MKFEFVVNSKTAKQIGRTVPPNLLVRADRSLDKAKVKIKKAKRKFWIEGQAGRDKRFC